MGDQTHTLIKLCRCPVFGSQFNNSPHNIFIEKTCKAREHLILCSGDRHIKCAGVQFYEGLGLLCALESCNR